MDELMDEFRHYVCVCIVLYNARYEGHHFIIIIIINTSPSIWLYTQSLVLT